MSVHLVSARHKANVGGRLWYFCCAGCKDKFTREPNRYLAASGGSG